MSEPTLFVIAGCNGSGKSTYSESLLPKEVSAFDADKVKKDFYNAFSFDFDYRDQMAWNKTQQKLEKDIESAIERKENFAYETNFNDEPLHWVKKFKAAGYLVSLFFFSLKSIELAKERVFIRFQTGGHYVPDDEVENRYKAGFNNLDIYFKEFDSIMILESSTIGKKPKTLFLYDTITMKAEEKELLPSYFKRYCPNLSAFIADSKTKEV